MEEDKPRAPKDTKELLWWLVFEWGMLGEYSNSLKNWQERWQVIWYPYFLIILISFFIWLTGISIVAGFDLPNLFPEAYVGEFWTQWRGKFWTDFFFLASEGLSLFIVLLILSLIFGIVLDIARGLRLSLAIGFSCSLVLAFGRDSGLSWVVYSVYGLFGSLVYGFVGGLVVGIALSFIKDLFFNLITDFFLALVFSLILGFFIAGVNKSGLVYGMGTTLGVISGHFRIVPYFVWYALKFFRKQYNLKVNPHRWDYAIYFSIPGLQHKLAQEAVENPVTGSDLSNFLLQKRRYQNKLAYCLQHASFAGTLRQNRLNFQILDFPELPDKAQTYKPTPRWYTLLQQTRETLADAERENNIHTRLQYWAIFTQRLQEFKAQTITEPRVWSQYYLPSLEKWEKSAAERRAELELEAQNAEPICRNIYRGGEKLDPRVDKRIFLGRDDLRDSFKIKVLTAQSMPLFFIQGQRRVGKSSLINFLPEFLGSGFVVVQYDMQEEPGDVLAWLQALRQRFHRQLQPAKEPPEWAPPEDWVEAWKEVRAELEELAAKDGRRFILAIDEYETLHGYLQKDPEQAARLLSAIRSFSQGQNQVVLLFAGADFFSELKAPNWNEYFPQAVTLYVDYLKKPDAFQLIQAVELRYPPELLEEMYEQTQGHPALLQKICQEIVTIANTEGKRDITADDFQRVLSKHILRPVNGVTDVFWGQFCELRGLQPAVRQLINGEEITDQRALLQLEDHGFIIKKDGRWKLRAPIFEKWVERYS